MICIGVDPGKLGGLAAIDAAGDVVRVENMPAHEADVLTFFRDMRAGDPHVFAALEHVHAMPKQGVSSVFTFGMGYGGLRMALVACTIPFEEVTPMKWQKSLGCLSKGNKNVTRGRARELFGSKVQPITHLIADALLLAEYMRRLERGALPW